MTCPNGYYFHPTRRVCTLGLALVKEQDHDTGVVKGTRVSSASPMFPVQRCVARGIVPYPDYRYYVSCELIEGSTLEFTQTIYQCPFGLFYNSLYRKCTKPSLFCGRQVRYP